MNLFNTYLRNDNKVLKYTAFINLIQCLVQVIITECCYIQNFSLQSKDCQYGMKDVS